MIYADASLTDALRHIHSEFVKTHTDAWIEFKFIASDDLIARLDSAPTVNYVASANPDVFTHLSKQNRIESEPRVFARRPLAIVIARTNPKRILRLQDLNRSGLRVALARPDTRLGQHSRALLERLQDAPRFRPNFVEQFTDAVIAQPSSGLGILNLITQHHADVGIVFTTDLLNARSRVLTLDLPGEYYAADELSIAALASGHDKRQPEPFVDFLFTPLAQDILAAHGFESWY